MDLASKNGDINLLNELLNNSSQKIYNDANISEKYVIEYTANAMNWASENGHVNVLDWWKNSGLKLKYTTKAFYVGGKVRNWWINSGLTTNHLFNNTIQVPIKDHLDMLRDILNEKIGIQPYEKSIAHSKYKSLENKNAYC